MKPENCTAEFNGSLASPQSLLLSIMCDSRTEWFFLLVLISPREGKNHFSVGKLILSDAIRPGVKTDATKTERLAVQHISSLSAENDDHPHL